VVNRLTESGGAVEAAIALAEEVCASSPVSVRETLAAMAGQLDEDDARGWAATAHALEAILASEDMQEGVTAFFERRPPQWRGR
jgi:enoyl-CoA hydratase/carnithine racemase